MVGKIKVGRDPEKIVTAIEWAKKHGINWVNGNDTFVPLDAWGLFVNGEALTYTIKDYSFDSSEDPDITGIVFGDTAKDDAEKPRLTLVPLQIVFDIARVREYAVRHKYKDPENWKQVSPGRYREAAFRHFLRYLDDPDGVDDESGLPHLSHLATNIAFLCALKGENDADSARP